MSEVELIPFFLMQARDIDFRIFMEQIQGLHLPYRIAANEQIRNITDWGLQQFQNRYQLNESSSPVCYAASKEIREDFKLDAAAKGEITKEDIFYYTYAVLHNPAYRKKYELNLKRAFPRIPFYDNFFQCRDWGKKLMELHMNYESVQP